MTNIATLPSIGNAKIPATYNAAKIAISECARIDECKDWADKSEALASYAKQSKDESLRKMADRIQARAIRRCGELLRAIERPEQGGRPLKNGTDGHIVSRAEAAKEAGLSKHQKDTALRVAAVSADTFEAAVESEAPPTVTELAKAGTKSKPLVDHGRDPKEFSISTRGQGDLARFVEMTKEVEPEILIRGAMAHEIESIINNAAFAAWWLGKLSCELKEKNLL